MISAAPSQATTSATSRIGIASVSLPSCRRVIGTASGLAPSLAGRGGRRMTPLGPAWQDRADYRERAGRGATLSSVYNLVLESEPSRDDVRAVERGLSDYNLRFTCDDHFQRLAIFVRDAESGAIAGGLVGETFWEWLHIDLLWLADELRGQNYGSRLLAMAEDEARRRGCRHA